MPTQQCDGNLQQFWTEVRARSSLLHLHRLVTAQHLEGYIVPRARECSRWFLSCCDCQIAWFPNLRHSHITCSIKLEGHWGFSCQVLYVSLFVNFTPQGTRRAPRIVSCFRVSILGLRGHWFYGYYGGLGFNVEAPAVGYCLSCEI